MPTEYTSSHQDPDGKHAEKRTIPKFASFRPRAPSKHLNQGIPASENVSRLSKPHDIPPNESISRPKPRRQTLGRHHSREHHKRSVKREVSGQAVSEPAKQDLGTGENSAKSFVVDRIGDPDNLNFGGLHRYATPTYFRYGAGSVLASHGNQRIDRALSNEKGLVLSDDTQSLPKRRDRHARWRLKQDGAKEQKRKPREQADSKVDSAADYVSLEVAHRAKRRRGDDRLRMDCVSNPDEDDTHYRSVEGKAKSKKVPVDQDLKYNSDTSSSQDIFGSGPLALDESARIKRVQLMRRVDVEPSNFEAWIDLINHQDSVLGLGQSFKRTRLTNAERRSNAEIKISMFEKALEQVKNLEGREVLLLGMMQEATKIWGIDKSSSCWRSILQQNPRSSRLWTKYLDFMQTSFTNFRFGEVQNAYLDCLNLTHGARRSGMLTPDELDKIFNIQIYVVLRMTLFMRESGFAELATATWQALLEFVFFRPIIVQGSELDKDGLSHKATVSMFEIFWDSEVRRIGEQGAEGWASFSQKQGEPPQPTTETADDLEFSKDYWESWLTSERRHGLLSRHPARTLDDIEENDPYRIILYADVRPFLIDPPSHAGRQLTLDAFIAFCGLPPFAADGPDSYSRIWRRDCFLYNDALQLNGRLRDLWKLHFPKQSQSSEDHESIDKEDAWLHSGMQNPFQCPVRDYQVSSDSLFAEKQWFSAFDTWREQSFGDGGPVEVAWVLRSLKSLVSVGAGEDILAEYALALEFRNSPGTVRKAAKSILQKRPFSIRLYNAYALIEYRLADIKRGEGIITMSINKGKILDEVSRRDCILLWRTWIWETLSTSSAQEAFVRLLTIANEEIQTPFPELHLLDEPITLKPALLLRAETALIAIRDHMLSLSSHFHAILAIECLVLFAYLRNAQSLCAATSAFKSNIALLFSHPSSRCSEHEYLHQSFARLIHYHATHTYICKPSGVRSLLAESLAQFPQNTIFLSLYAWNEARFRIDDRVRSVVKELILGNGGDAKSNAQDNVMLHFFAVYSEVHRGVTFGSNISTIRSTFERAVESSSGAHCAGIWKLYFLFEHSRSEPERAKAVFWRGLRACPWAKDLYMLAFEHLRGERAMGEADLRGIYELLGKKELRVHVGSEEFFEGLHETQ